MLFNYIQIKFELFHMVSYLSEMSEIKFINHTATLSVMCLSSVSVCYLQHPMAIIRLATLHSVVPTMKFLHSKTPHKTQSPS